MQKYPPIRPAGRIRSETWRDRHRQETEQDRRFQITHKKKSTIHIFVPKTFSSATAWIISDFFKLPSSSRMERKPNKKREFCQCNDWLFCGPALALPTCLVFFYWLLLWRTDWPCLLFCLLLFPRLSCMKRCMIEGWLLAGRELQNSHCLGTHVRRERAFLGGTRYMSHSFVPYLIYLVGFLCIVCMGVWEWVLWMSWKEKFKWLIMRPPWSFCRYSSRFAYDYGGNNVQWLQKDRRLLFILFARVDHDDDDDRSSGVSDSSKITYNPSH